MANFNLTVNEIQGVAQIVIALSGVAIAGIDAVRRAIRAIKGDSMSEVELNAIAKWVEEDATFREALARAESGR